MTGECSLLNWSQAGQYSIYLPPEGWKAEFAGCKVKYGVNMVNLNESSLLTITT